MKCPTLIFRGSRAVLTTDPTPFISFLEVTGSDAATFHFAVMNYFMLDSHIKSHYITSGEFIVTNCEIF